MPHAAQLRAQIEEFLAPRIPSALTPQPRLERALAKSGIAELDLLLSGGLPIGAITELVGSVSSGRTSFAISVVVQAMLAGKVCAWVDVNDSFDPESAASSGADLDRLLWVRCGEGETQLQPASSGYVPSKVEARSEPIPAGGSPHPRNEAMGLPLAVEAILGGRGFRRARGVGTPGAPNRNLASADQAQCERKEQVAYDRLPARRGEYILAQHRGPIEPVCAEAQRKERPALRQVAHETPSPRRSGFQRKEPRPWQRLDQALRAADLLLAAGGFGVLVLDMGSITPEAANRVPLATWFRFRAAADRTRAVFLLLTQHSCAQSSADVLLKSRAILPEGGTVLHSISYAVDLVRQRTGAPESKVVSMRKPPQRATTATWQAKPSWVGDR